MKKGDYSPPKGVVCHDNQCVPSIVERLCTGAHCLRMLCIGYCAHLICCSRESWMESILKTRMAVCVVQKRLSGRTVISSLSGFPSTL